MTNEAATDTRQWLVSARTRGELLATTARSNGIELVMVGVPAGYSAEEVESWLRDLMGMAAETANGEAAAAAIPPLLHHLLTGLLFSHAELWDRGGAVAPTSMAFIRTANEVAFGWVNGPYPELWIDDRRAEVEWVRIRDPEGREACALAIHPAHRVRVHFGFADAGVTVASVDGAWVPESAAAPAAEPDPASAPGRAGSTISRAVGARATIGPEVDVTPPPFEMPDPAQAPGSQGWTVVYEGDALAPPPAAPSRSRPWWAGVTEWISGNRRGAHRDDDWPERAIATPDRVPPTPEPAELTARTAPIDPAPGAIQLAPLAPEDPVGAAPAASAAAAELEVESVHLETPVSRRPALAPPPVAPPAPVASPAASTAPPAAAPDRSPGKMTKVAPPPAARAPQVAATAAAVNASAAPAAASAPKLSAMEMAFDDADSGLLSAPARAPRRARTLDFPGPVTPVDRPWWAKPWAWGSAVVLLFLVGWLLGNQNDHADGEPGGFMKALRAVGLAGARFETRITSEPAGAWISVDGKDLARRTPATVELTPGKHKVALSIADLGSATYDVRGVRGDHEKLDANLAGSLTVYAADGGLPVAVTVDGVARGLAPVTIDALEPGTHEVRFSGPGLQPWGRTVQVKIHETAEIAARAVTSPATGVLVARAQWTDSDGSEELKGATVWIDGEKRGVTPLSLELPRGPHSVRIESRGEESPVQVIDLPGGNQRFANFELGLGIEHPNVTVLGTPLRLRADEPSVVSASIAGVRTSETREMWLNVRQPDGTWRRTPMTLMNSAGGVVGTALLASGQLDAQGRVLFYVSASSPQGDDYFSEILSATLASK